MEISKERIRSLENQLEKSESERDLKVEKEIDREIKQNEQNEQNESTGSSESTGSGESTGSSESVESNESNAPLEQTDQSSNTEHNAPQSAEPQPSSPSPSTLGPPQPDHPPESEPDEESAQQIDELNRKISELTSQLEEAKQINLFCFSFASYSQTINRSIYPQSRCLGSGASRMHQGGR